MRTENDKRPRQEDAEGANMENGIREPQCKGTENQRDEQENTQDSLINLGWCYEYACQRAEEVEASNKAYLEENAELLGRLRQPFRIGDDMWEIVRSPRHDGSVESTLVRRTRQSVKERFPERGFIETTPYFHSAINLPDNLTSIVR